MLMKSYHFVSLLVVLLPYYIQCWPEGSYGLPMSKTGCPQADQFKWHTGSRTHHTKEGSHGSPDNHLAGIYDQSSDKITQSFCIKTSSLRDGSYSWSAGSYCIYKLNACPSGFKEGSIYWDDAAPFIADTIQNHSGMLPDGDYDRNTKIFYCCRNDGSIADSISLPNTVPFHLLMLGDACQRVHGMHASEEWIYFRDQPTLNLNSQDGLHPKLSRYENFGVVTKLFFCYYVPKAEEDSFHRIVLVFYVIGGLVGGIAVLLLCMCALQHFLSYKPKECEEGNLANIMRERVLGPHFNSNSPGTIVSYNSSSDPPLVTCPDNFSDRIINQNQSLQNNMPNGNVSTSSNNIIGPTTSKNSKYDNSFPRVCLPTSDSEDSVLSGHTESDERAPMLNENASAFQMGDPPSYDEVLRQDGKLT